MPKSDKGNSLERIRKLNDHGPVQSILEGRNDHFCRTPRGPRKSYEETFNQAGNDASFFDNPGINDDTTSSSYKE